MDPQHVEVLQSSILKESADQELNVKNYRKAIHLYTEALEIAPPTHIEFKRILLANRAQSYIFYGDIHSARHDVNLALSPQYTTENSPIGLTIECLFRRAKLLCMFASYDEALSDYEWLTRIRSGPNIGMSESEALRKSIDEGCMQVPESDERQQKDDLMRAVDSRGIIIQDQYRSNFPLPPVEMLDALGPDFDSKEMCLAFNTDNGRADFSLSDPNKTPISIPLYIMAPYFEAGPTTLGGQPFKTREENPVAEDESVESVLSGLFMSFVGYGGNSFGFQSALLHESSSESVVVVTTYRGRLLVIPRKTTFKEIAAGARWPRNGPLAFEDMRKAPRVRCYEEDGIELGWGWFMNIYVVPNLHLEQFLIKLESGLRPPG